jgi:hypothetical protein
MVDRIAKCLQQTTLLETESQIVGAFANWEKHRNARMYQTSQITYTM